MNTVTPDSTDQPDRKGMTFLRWTGLFTLAAGAVHAVQLVLIALITRLPIRRFGVIYLLFVWVAYDTGVLIYWSRFWPVRRLSIAFRFAVAMFASLNLYLGLILFGAYHLGLISKASALFEYGPYVVPGAAIPAVMSYLVGRQLTRGNDDRG